MSCWGLMGVMVQAVSTQHDLYSVCCEGTTKVAFCACTTLAAVLIRQQAVRLQPHAVGHCLQQQLLWHAQLLRPTAGSVTSMAGTIKTRQSYTCCSSVARRGRNKLVLGLDHVDDQPLTSIAAGSLILSFSANRVASRVAS